MKKTEVTQEQIDAWKVKYDGVFRIRVEDKVCYLKQPDRKILSFAAKAGATDNLKFNEVILNNCWLAGDEEMKTNDGLFLSVCVKLSELIEIKEAELEKL